MEKKQESKKETLTEIDPKFFEQKVGYAQHTSPSKLHSDPSSIESMRALKLFYPIEVNPFLRELSG
jgi:hypothetical protein